ncbi:hypothetical protein FRC03_008894 [Tulasnella sp. 419]|nr:hypothetical protein FRC02_011252 [Tulasnella sp. 418]KAG8968029.1 hypothetical protein FRC03_008894 [Tulasnella sp. 419]
MKMKMRVAPQESAPVSDTWKPPKGYEVVNARGSKMEVETPFDYETLDSDQDLELWLFRLPPCTTIEDITTTKIPVETLPDVIELDHMKRNCFSLKVHPSIDEADSHNEDTIGSFEAQELKDLAYFVPSQQDGKLHQVPPSRSRLFSVARSSNNNASGQLHVTEKHPFYPGPEDVVDRPAIIPTGTLGQETNEVDRKQRKKKKHGNTNTSLQSSQ